MSRYSRKARKKRALVALWVAFILSLAADAVIHFTLGYTLITPENFKVAYCIYLLIISLPIGVLFSLAAVFATKDSYEARDKAPHFAFLRALLLWILGMAGAFIHDNWVPADPLDPSGAVGTVFGHALIAGLVFLGVQFFLCLKLLELKSPTDDRPTVPSRPSTTYSSRPDPEEERRQQEEEEYKKHWDIVNNQ